MKLSEILKAIHVDPELPLPAWILNAEVAPHEAGEKSREVVHAGYEHNNHTLYLECE